MIGGAKMRLLELRDDVDSVAYALDQLTVTDGRCVLG